MHTTGPFVALVLALAPPALAEVVALPGIVAGLGTATTAFPGCTGTAQPTPVDSLVGELKQIRLTCEGMPGIGVFLSYAGPTLRETYFRATDAAAEQALAELAGKLVQTPEAFPPSAEVTYASYPGGAAVRELTVSDGAFSWELLPGKSDYERLQTLATVRANVELSPRLPMRLPVAGDVTLVATTFKDMGGAHPSAPGLTILHALDKDDKTVARFYAQLPGAFGGLSGGFDGVDLGPGEKALRYVSGYLGQGYRMERSLFYRLTPGMRRATLLALTEGASDTQGSLGCMDRGECREVRYVIRPGAEQGASGLLNFTVVRIETRRSPGGKVLSTTEAPFGTCAYDAARKDYACPPLPDDASI